MPTHTFMVTGKDVLHVKSPRGDIRIHEGQVNTVVVTATKRTPIVGNFGDNLKVDYKQTGNDITVEVEGNSGGLFFNSAYIDLDITVPTESDLDVYDSSGDITVSDISGLVKAETGSGDIDVSRTQGTTTLKTGSGDIETRDTNGSANIQTGSGDITLRDARLEGESVLHSGSGDIKFDGSLASNGDYTIETGSGDINLALPVDSSLQLNIDSSSGDVDNDFHTRSIGDDPRAPVFIHTGSGDISIHEQ
ncbi:hypothetical protein KSX_44430 [Ktedonospora formicarum]|uniref:DUF4097 domain-containing protein n=1 Tax=Ktedonospora formicarum TaxID=2778364 RepID=A0A8J3MV93_9CHLR|nr:hypothetical protein KSX_44430 [Ktedonospora formicarum]